MRTLILAGALAIVSVGALAAQSGTRVALEAPHQHKEKLVRLLKQRFPEADAITAVVRDNRLYLCVWDGGQAEVGTLLFDGSLRSQLADLKNTKESGPKSGSVGPAQVVLREPGTKR